jgi:acetyltransferase-like isoleucine patch superfamily enzyme
VFLFPLYKLQLGKIGAKSRLINAKLSGAKRIFIGSKVYIQSGAWLAADPLTGDNNCMLSIDDGTYIGRFSHIYATSKINIGKKVLIAEKVYISDNLHDYKNINLPIIDQPIIQKQQVEIGDGAWLGENVCIIGASVGKNSVIGANSVVTKNIPDFCIAIGTPAIIIKRYNFKKNQWQQTDAFGKFEDE